MQLSKGFVPLTYAQSGSRAPSYAAKPLLKYGIALSPKYGPFSTAPIVVAAQHRISCKSTEAKNTISASAINPGTSHAPGDHHSPSREEVLEWLSFGSISVVRELPPRAAIDIHADAGRMTARAKGPYGYQLLKHG